MKSIDDLVLSSDGGYYLGISGGLLVSCCLLYSRSTTFFNMIQTMNSDVSRGKLKEHVRLIIMLLFLRHRSLLKNTSGNHVCLFTKAYFVLPNHIRIIQQSCESWCSVLCFYEPQKSLLNGASQVVQWLRICLLMQGTRVRALAWEDPTCRRAAGPVSHNC